MIIEYGVEHVQSHLPAALPEDISSDEARREWLGSHGQLALTLPGIRRYVQNHWVAAPEGHVRLYDGSVDLWFDDESAFKNAFSSPQGEAMLKDDLRIFDRSMDIPYVGGVVDEHVMLGDDQVGPTT